jgi:hypothetical protein
MTHSDRITLNGVTVSKENLVRLKVNLLDLKIDRDSCIVSNFTNSFGVFDEGDFNRFSALMNYQIAVCVARINIITKELSLHEVEVTARLVS